MFFFLNFYNVFTNFITNQKRKPKKKTNQKINNKNVKKKNVRKSEKLHFHLKNSLMIGKRAVRDFQAYFEVIERFEDIGRGGRDFDGMRQEQEEKRKIARMNKIFAEYAENSKNLAKKFGYKIEFEEPEMDLGFTGVPGKQSVKIYPTANCLIALDDSPPFVVNVRTDIEIAHFERVAYSLREFDLVLVFKDFTKEPIRISSIPRSNLRRTCHPLRKAFEGTDIVHRMNNRDREKIASQAGTVQFDVWPPAAFWLPDVTKSPQLQLRR